jgi:hypothetical protein
MPLSSVLSDLRGLLENAVSMVQSRRALNTRWHGSFSLLAAIPHARARCS